MDDGNFPLLQSMTIVAAALVAACSLILDVVLARLDPRVRLSLSARR
jgi:ABC-type dipeptide/oligopeptide/nickel transport system permease component